MSTLQPDRSQAAAFLRFLDPEPTRFTFQTFDDSSHKRPSLAMVLHGSLDSLWDALTSLSQRGAGVFVCVITCFGVLPTSPSRNLCPFKRR